MQYLHTLLLGSYKYLLRAKMAKLTQKEHAELSARISAFPASGRIKKMFTDIAMHYKSFIGRDIKALALLALSPFLSPSEKEVWLALSKVCAFTHLILIFSISLYCRYSGWRIARILIQKRWCTIEICVKVLLGLLKHTFLSGKPIHLLLHLPDDMLMYGPTAAFNTERYIALHVHAKFK